MPPFLPQARIGIDQTNLRLPGLHGLGDAVAQVGINNTRSNDLASLAELAKNGASTEAIAQQMAQSGDPTLATLGLRTLERGRARTDNREFAQSGRDQSQRNSDRSFGLQEEKFKASQAQGDKRKILKGVDGKQRFVDTGEQVFPDIEDPKRKAAEDQKAARKDQKSTAAKVVVQDIDRAIKLTEGEGIFSPATGLTGQALQFVGGTRARDVQGLVETIKANTGFDRLQQMRESSPTGGALGQVSNLEIGLLNAALGNLDQSQTQEQFTDNLRRVKNIYLDIIHGKDNGPQREKLGFESGSKDVTSMSDDDLLKALGG